MSHPLVVFSHLRWDFVYQRPQHLLTRLAQHRPVFVIEEPVRDDHAAPHWERSEPAENVTVLRPHTPVERWGFNDEQAPHLESLLDELADEQGLRGATVWLYTPMALDLAERLEPAALVYDRMDALAQFAHAPPEMTRNEGRLLEAADVVFTGGPSLYRGVEGRNPNLHCFPSSVDAAHFGRALDGLAEPDDQAGLPHPRLGYFGVVDERMDLEAVRALAEAHPEWAVVMVGPVVKIDPATLPQAPNLHWLGQKPYEALPAYLGGWDVALLPFARNESTEFISPTKTLEYFAAEVPTVSTPITDVAEPYGDVVYLGDTPEAFVSACEQALSASDAERERRTTMMRGVLAETSWDRTAAAMMALMPEPALSEPAMSEPAATATT